MKPPRARINARTIRATALLALSALVLVILARSIEVQSLPESLPIQQIADQLKETAFANRQTGANMFARSDEVRRVATGLDTPDNPKVAVALETARQIFHADLVYVLDRTGKVVSCTPYENSKTLTGHDYAFKPNFRSALAGRSSVYPAVGAATGQRELYFSAPIVDPLQRTVGVIVIQVSLDSIDAILAQQRIPIFLVSPDGVIFASNRRDMLYQCIRPMPQETLEGIKASQQYAGNELRTFPALFDIKQTIRYQGASWHASDRAILAGWSLLVLERGGHTYAIDRNLALVALGALLAMAGIIAILIFVLQDKHKVEMALRESEGRFREANAIQSLILDNSTVGIAFLRHRRFEWVNARMCEMFDLSKDQLQGASTRIIYATDEEYDRIGRIAYPALNGGQRFQSEIQCQRSDGTLIWSQILGKALDPGKPEEGSIWIFEDITARRRSEEELATHREHLEDLVERRTVELREAKDQAEAATKAKSIFLASMSHELRTPLNAILGYAQLLERTVGDPDSRDNLQRIHRAGEHLLGLINHVLSLSKIEAGKLSLDQQAFAMEPFFRAIEEMTRVRAQAKGLVFRLEVRPPFPVSLVGDSLKLRQVLMNLLGNAVKFTQRGEVTLQVARNGDMVRFSVHDTGPGMTPEEAAGLFQSFHQTKAENEGTGLGLHISQAMVHLMGGRIEVQSQPGQGSVFSFEVPMAEGDLTAVPEAKPSLDLAPGQPSRRMLVVDDVEDNRMLLAKLFVSLGLEAREAPDGSSALILWEAWQPQVVWMDLRMPGMDGYEAVRRLRAREAELGRSRTVVVAITASVLDLDMAQLRSQGFDDLIGKPFPMSELLEKLHRHCGLALQQEAPAPASIPRTELAARIATLDPGWLAALDRALAIGDGEEAQGLLDALPARDLANILAGPLKEFRFEDLRTLLAQGRSHD